MAITKYDLDINKQAIIKPVVILRQGDHDIDTMQVSLSVANEPMDLTGATVTFMGNTADGRQIIDDAHVKIIDAKGGVFEYVFPSEASSDIGEYKVAYFSIILGNGQSSTMDFRVQVLSGVDISAPVASEYISHYDTMVSELNSAYDSFVNETDDKMASTVSSLATSAATVLDSALARVNDVDSKANHASSVAADAVSMASSVASDVTSQASYINSVASSAASNVSSVAAGVVDKLNNLSIGGRNLLLNTGKSFTGVGNNSENGDFNAQGGQYYLAGGKTVADLYNQYGPSQYLTLSFDWEASGDNISGQFNPQWFGTPWLGLGVAGDIKPSNTNKSGHYKKTVQLNSGGYSTGEATSIMIRQDNLQGSVTISNVKLEAGNLATDWTPAPEDADNTYVKKSGDSMSGDLTVPNLNVGIGNLHSVNENYTTLNNTVIPTKTVESDTNLDDLVETGVYFVGAYAIAKTLKNYPGNSNEYNDMERIINGTGYDMIGSIEVNSNNSPALNSKWLFTVQRVTYYRADRSVRRVATRVISSDGNGVRSYSDWDIQVIDMVSGNIPWVNGGNGTSTAEINYRISGNTLTLAATGTYTTNSATTSDMTMSGTMPILKTLQSYTTISNWLGHGMFLAKYARYRFLDGVVIGNFGTGGATTGPTWHSINATSTIYIHRGRINY